jgi:uncharacterized membrane protein
MASQLEAPVDFQSVRTLASQINPNLVNATQVQNLAILGMAFILLKALMLLECIWQIEIPNLVQHKEVFIK